MSDYLAEPGLETSPTPLGETPSPLRNTLRALRNRWWLALGVAAAVVGYSTWRTARQQRLYQATATVQVEIGRPMVGPFTQPQFVDWRVDPLQSQMVIIKSQTVAERVADSLGTRLVITAPERVQRTRLFGRTPPRVEANAADYEEYTLRLDNDNYSLRREGRVLATARYGDPVATAGIRFAVPKRPTDVDRDVTLRVIPLRGAGQAIRGQIATRGQPQTNLIDITYRGTDPEFVQMAANVIAHEYSLFADETRQTEARKRTQYIEAQLDSMRGRLALAQDEVERFQKAQQLSDVKSEQDALITSIYEFERQRNEALLEQNSYLTLLGKLDAADTVTDELRKLASTEAVAKNSYMSRLYERWFDLVQEREKRKAMSDRPSDSYREIQSVDALIASTKQDLRIASGNYLANLRSRVSSLTAKIDTLRRDMTRYPELAAQQAKLFADVGTIQGVYDLLQRTLQESRITASATTGGVTVIDLAQPPFAPYSPNRRRAFMTAIVIGLLLGVGAAILLDNLDQSVKSPDEITNQMGLAVLGTIPAIKEVVSLEPDDSRLVTHLDPRSPVAEAYRSLRTNLAFARAHQAVKTILLTSPGPSDGKSTTVANLAITFAQQGQRTLLIDADLRRAVLDKLFSVPRQPGLTDVLVGQKKLSDVAHQTEINNLFVLGSGPFPPNPAELLGSSAMRDALRDANDHFDVVLIDSPPLLAVTDAAVLSTMVDAAVLVVRMGSTARTAVRRAIGQLQAVTGPLIGAVLNDVDFKQGGYSGYGYYYYYYYHYGQEGGGNGRRHGRGVLDRVRRWTSRAKPTKPSKSRKSSKPPAPSNPTTPVNS